HRVGYKMNAADPVRSAFATAEVLSSPTLISATSLRRCMEGSTLNICAGMVELRNAPAPYTTAAAAGAGSVSQYRPPLTFSHFIRSSIQMTPWMLLLLANSPAPNTAFQQVPAR
ncbi:hypothetical protein, partial [Intestinirhabdus alba]|uniref:hypothetical protein n=1 Tax=Intestinirhabdus alba TaxID=2899544 RepID=UPI001AE00D9D